jgi:hypothetical protein
MSLDAVVIGVVGALLLCSLAYGAGFVYGIRWAFTHPRKILDTLDTLREEDERRRRDEAA